jgi:hypothetical protein
LKFGAGKYEMPIALLFLDVVRQECAVVVCDCYDVFSEADTSGHSSNHPTACQNSTVLCLGKFEIFLVYRFTNQHIVLNRLCFISLLYKIRVIVEVIAHQDAVALSPELRFTHPLLYLKIIDISLELSLLIINAFCKLLLRIDEI